MASGFFDEPFRLQELTQMGDPLERLNKHIDFETFRELLESGFDTYDKSKGGRPPFDMILMFKGLVLKSMYNLSFEKFGFHIKDRLSFQRFLGIGLGDRVPEANTFWDYNEAETNKALIDEVFDQLGQQLEEKGLILNSGSLVDAGIVDAPACAEE